MNNIKNSQVYLHLLSIQLLSSYLRKNEGLMEN